MEAHKPHHLTHKKKWGEYFLEFLMLFLAVFLGFVAENIRERASELSKAKELAESLYEEVYADSVTLNNKIALRLQKEDQMQYCRRYVSDSNLTDLSEKFYPSFAWTTVLTTTTIFEPNEAYTQNGKLTILEALQENNDHSSIRPVIKHLSEFNREDAEGLVAYYLIIVRATRQLHYQAYIDRNHELPQALRDEYGFKHG